MNHLPLVSVCFFCRRRTASVGVGDDGIRGMFLRGFTGQLRQSFGFLKTASQLRMPIPLRNDCAKHLDEFGLIMMSSEAACPDQARKKTQYFYVMVDGVEILRKTKYFLGNYEIEIDDAGNERKLHYISAGDGVFAIVEKVNQADAQIHYIHKNYLGSYDAITNHLGVVEERLSFDPWGRRRNPNSGIVDDGIYSMFDRGFTGHQHLDEFGLINMNGHLYDPVLARFLSPDPFMQAPDNLQNHNRYSYALNNPLRYTDPSGEWIHLAIGAFIGGIINWATHGAQFNAAGLGYFGVGALAGGLAAGIGAGIGAVLAGEAAAGGGFSAGFMGTATISSTGFLAGAVAGGGAGLTNGFITGAGNAFLAGQNFNDAFLKGALNQAWKQALGGVAFGGIMGTLDAIHNGEDWLTGSPFKKIAYTNGEQMMTPDAASGKILTDVQKEASRELPVTDQSYPIEIKAPKGWKINDGAFQYSSDDNLLFIQHVTENNSLIVEFPSGTPNGGYYAAAVSQPVRLLNTVNHKIVLFYKNERELSTLFWYLNLFQK